MRVFGYCRVSREARGQVSPAIQRAEIGRYCQQKGWTVIRWFEDIDWSATRYRPLDMPGFSEMISLAEDGETDVVVFYRADRAVREHVGEFQLVRASLKRSGVQVAFAGREYDDTPEGEFALDLDMILAKLEGRRLGKRLRDMHAELARQGKHPGGVNPFGWNRVRDPDGSQRLVLDPKEAPWRIKMHEWLQAGWTMRAIARELNRNSVLTRNGAGWRASSVRIALKKQMQTGARVKGGEVYRTGRIEPLINVETFERTMAIIDARAYGPAPGRPSKGVIPTDLMVCGTCGGRLYASKTPKDEGALRLYNCESAMRGGLCAGGVHIREKVLLAEVEPLILHGLSRLAVQARRAPAPEISVAPLRAEEEMLEISLARLAALYSIGGLPEREYRRASEIQRRKLEPIREKLKRAPAKLMKGRIEAVVGDAQLTKEMWDLLPTEAKQALVRVVVDRIIVEPVGHYSPQKGPRTRVIWR